MSRSHILLGSWISEQRRVYVAKQQSREIIKLQEKDDFCVGIKRKILQDLGLSKKYLEFDGVLYKRENLKNFLKIMIPETFKQKILFECYNAPTKGHFDYELFLEKINNWPKMS